jgi:hypothetical protein
MEIISVAGGTSKWTCAGLACLGAEFQTEKLVLLLNQMCVGKFFLGQILNA